MSASDEEVVGHKTFHYGQGGFRHEPLTRSEADALWKEVERKREQRAADMPTEQDAVNALSLAYERLKELGWTDASYAPFDRETWNLIEIGSSGIHEGYRMDDGGGWWVPAHGDLWPSRPILVRRKDGAR